MDQQKFCYFYFNIRDKLSIILCYTRDGPNPAIFVSLEAILEIYLVADYF